MKSPRDPQDAGRAAFASLLDLASRRLGGAVVGCSDEFFAPAANLLEPDPPRWEPDRYTDRGKWMDGWESRRRRGPGHDWVVIRLGAPGEVRGVVVDTAHFRGNQPERCAVDLVELDRGDEDRLADGGPWLAWRPAVPPSRLEPDAVHAFPVADEGRATHVRLAIHPDGGVARLRVHGAPRPDWASLAGREVDLAAAVHGGRIVGCSDAAFGAAEHLLLPGRAEGMRDGWETRRRRGPGHDWVVVALGHRGRIARVEVDTHHFKGNYPESCRVEAVDLGDPGADVGDADWIEVVPRTALGPDRAHAFESTADRPATHLRLSIHPDGGVARLRVLGRPLVAGAG